MKQEKAGWKTIVLYVLGVIFAATFVYGVVYSIMNVMSTVTQYTSMGQNIPASYTVNAIVSGIVQLALPSLFFCAGSFALGYLVRGKDNKDDVEKIEITETVETEAPAEDAKEADVAEETADADKADNADASEKAADDKDTADDAEKAEEADKEETEEKDAE